MDPAFFISGDSMGGEYEKPPREALPKICEMILTGIETDFGEIAPFEMLVAIERYKKWHTDITASQSDVEQILFDRHCSFDADIWLKVQRTHNWKKFHLKLESLSKKYLALAIDEVVQSELQDMAPPTDPLL
jgi:hypothetical protein